jgi:hypothetical protein
LENGPQKYPEQLASGQKQTFVAGVDKSALGRKADVDCEHIRVGWKCRSDPILQLEDFRKLNENTPTQNSCFNKRFSE